MSRAWSRLKHRRKERGGRRGRRGGKNYGPPWYADEWRPPNTDNKKNVLPFEWVRFFPGEYVECENCGVLTLGVGYHYKCWFCKHEGAYGPQSDIYPCMPGYMARFPVRRDDGKTRHARVVCRCHDGELKKPNGEPRECVSCHYGYNYHDRIIKEAEDERKGDDKLPKEVWQKANSRLPRPHLAHNLLQCGWFHVVEKTSDRGTKYTIHEHCIQDVRTKSGRLMTCKLCEEGVDRMHGRRAWWNPSDTGGNRGHLYKLRKYEDEKLSHVCANCGNSVQALEYTCPQCENVVIDCADTEIEETTIKEARSEEMRCQHCDEKFLLVEHLQCVEETEPNKWEKGCDDPRRLTIFDTDLAITSEGKGLNSKISIVDHRVCGLDEDLWPLAKPFDFKFLMTWSLDRQARVMKVDNPYSPDEKPEEGTEEYNKD